MNETDKEFRRLINSMRLILAGTLFLILIGTLLFYLGVLFPSWNIFVAPSFLGLILVSRGMFLLQKGEILKRYQGDLSANYVIVLLIAIFFLPLIVLFNSLPIKSLHWEKNQFLLAFSCSAFLFFVGVFTWRCIVLCGIMNDFCRRIENDNESWQLTVDISNLSESWAFSKKLLIRFVIFPIGFLYFLFIVFYKDIFTYLGVDDRVAPIFAGLLLLSWLPVWSGVHFILSLYRTIVVFRDPATPKEFEP